MCACARMCVCVHVSVDLWSLLELRLRREQKQFAIYLYFSLEESGHLSQLLVEEWSCLDAEIEPSDLSCTYVLVTAHVVLNFQIFFPAVQECEKIPPPIWGSYHCQTDNTGTERCYPACMEGYEFESPPAAEYVCVNGQFSPPGPYPNCRKSEGRTFASFCVCVNVCVSCVYECLLVCVPKDVCVWVCECVCARARARVCVYVPMCVYVCVTCVYECLLVCVPMCVCLRVRVCVCVCVPMCVCVCVRVCVCMSV